MKTLILSVLFFSISLQANDNALSTSQELNSSLFASIRENDIPRFDALVEQDVSFNIRDGRGRMPVHVVAQYGNREMVQRFLLERRGTFLFSQENQAGWPPLHVAVHYGNVVAIEEFLRAGAYIESKTKREGWTPLFLAVGDPPFVGHPERRLEIIDTLIELGRADVNTSGVRLYKGYTDFTALSMTVAMDDLDVVERLARAGADPNAMAQGGFPALIFALQNKNKDMVRFLIRRAGAEVRGVKGNMVSTVARQNGMWLFTLSQSLKKRENCFNS